ncbi:glycosyltransferase family 2 protein [Prochlorococcus sp. AH-716-P05]|nr:glycosyltransferase family 2 protein [Prochlorococcus sp. AH-716-P05]
MYKTFAIVIPFFYKNQNSLKQLKRCISSIRNQTFKDYEIILSVQNYFEKIKNDPFFSAINILNAEKVKGFIQGNINNAIKKSTSKWIVFLFSDDYFLSNNFLKKIFNKLDNKTDWIITGSLHTFNEGKDVGSPLPVIFHKNILSINTVGSPSGIIVRNKNPLFFDENTWIKLDVDYYYSLFKRYGHPLIIKSAFVVNEIHKDQFSFLLKKANTATLNKLKKEDQYLMKKYNCKLLSKLNIFILKFLYKLLKILYSYKYEITNFISTKFQNS